MSPEDADDLALITEAESVWVLATEDCLDWRIRMPSPARIVTITIHRVDDIGPGDGTA